MDKNCGFFNKRTFLVESFHSVGQNILYLKFYYTKKYEYSGTYNNWYFVLARISKFSLRNRLKLQSIIPYKVFKNLHNLVKFNFVLFWRRMWMLTWVNKEYKSSCLDLITNKFAKSKDLMHYFIFYVLWLYLVTFVVVVSTQYSMRKRGENDETRETSATMSSLGRLKNEWALVLV